MTSVDTSEARERVLDAAERLFAEKGYNAVTLRDIAAQVGIRHASLYHHVPGGKTQLFVEVTKRHFLRHQEGLSRAIADAEPHLRARLFAVADWLLSQPPMDLIRMTHSDMPSIDAATAYTLSALAYESLIGPIAQVLEQAQREGEIASHDSGLIAGGLLGMLESLHAVPEASLEQSRQDMAHVLIDMFLHGLYPRS